MLPITPFRLLSCLSVIPALTLTCELRLTFASKLIKPSYASAHKSQKYQQNPALIFNQLGSITSNRWRVKIHTGQLSALAMPGKTDMDTKSNRNSCILDSLSSACHLVIHRGGCIGRCRVQKTPGNETPASTQQSDNFQIDETEMLHIRTLLDSQGTILLVTLRQPPFQISTAWLVWSGMLSESIMP